MIEVHGVELLGLSLNGRALLRRGAGQSLQTEAPMPLNVPAGQSIPGSEGVCSFRAAGLP